MTVKLMRRAIQTGFWKFYWTHFQLPQIDFSQLCPEHTPEFPIISERLCMPPYAGDENLKDYSFLISLIKRRKPGIVLELGTAHGTTVANICAVSDARVFTVNALPEETEGNFITYSLPKDEIGSVYQKHGFADRVVPIYENTRNLRILDWVEPKSVDCAIIDACHDADFVINDFLKIRPSLSNNAIVLFHDTNPSLRGHFLESYLGCMYLRKMGFNIRHIAESSWAVWSAEDPQVHLSLVVSAKNLLHTWIGTLLFGGQDGFITEIRWLASGFLRGKFNVLN